MMMMMIKKSLMQGSPPPSLPPPTSPSVCAPCLWCNDFSIDITLHNLDDNDNDNDDDDWKSLMQVPPPATHISIGLWQWHKCRYVVSPTPAHWPNVTKLNHTIHYCSALGIAVQERLWPNRMHSLHFSAMYKRTWPNVHGQMYMAKCSWPNVHEQLDWVAVNGTLYCQCTAGDHQLRM